MNEWLELQVRHRWAGWPLGQTINWSEALISGCAGFGDLALYDSSIRGYSELNGFDQLCTWSAEKNFFEHTGRRAGRPRLGIRQTRFANLVHSWGLQGRFLSNWCDAQGWDYPECLPSLGHAPIIQYSRRIVQRGQVVLLPLPKHFMGPGGPNLPTEVDPVPFRQKRDQLVWRGTLSGTLSDWRKGQWWAESLFGPKVSADDFARALQVTRLRVARALDGCDRCNVKFSLTKEQMARTQSVPQFKAMLDGLIGDRLSIADQRNYKFLLVLDGNDIGTNKYWSLLSNSVVLLVKSEWETALDAGLLPNVHYVPVEANHESIRSAMDALLQDPERCEAIIAAAHTHLAGQLNPAWRDAADWATLQEYSSRFRSIPDLPQRWSYARS